MKSSTWFAAALVVTVVFAAKAVAQSERSSNFLVKQCNEDALQLRLDPKPFQEIIGSQFALVLEEGKARVLIVVQDCSQLWIDGKDLGPTQYAHVWVSIAGPQDVRPVVGAQQTRPTMTWFSLFTGSTNPRDRQARMASGTSAEPIEGISLDPPGSQRGGRVSLGAGLSYSWNISPVTPSFRLVGLNHDVYTRDTDGKVVLKRIQALGNLIAGPAKGTLNVVGGTDPKKLIGTGTYPVSVNTFVPIWVRATLGAERSKCE